MKKRKSSYEETINRVGIITIIWNVFLSIVKLIVGIIGKSQSMISDFIHSGSDVLTTVIVMIGAKISNKKSDEEHPYGHERFESIASIFLGVSLGIVSIVIGYTGINQLIKFKPGVFKPSSFVFLALAGSVLSVVIKGIMFIYTIKKANKINSTSLKADAWHHLSDSLSSIGSFLGIIGLMIGNGWEILDPIASIIICLIILKISFDIIKTSINQLVDRGIDKKEISKMREIVLSIDGVLSINQFYSRIFGNKVYFDIEVLVDKNMTFVHANEITIKVHDILESKYNNIKHCFVCARPSE